MLTRVKLPVFFQFCAHLGDLVIQGLNLNFVVLFYVVIRPRVVLINILFHFRWLNFNKVRIRSNLQPILIFVHVRILVGCGSSIHHFGTITKLLDWFASLDIGLSVLFVGLLDHWGGNILGVFCTTFCCLEIAYPMVGLIWICFRMQSLYS